MKWKHYHTWLVGLVFLLLIATNARSEPHTDQQVRDPLSDRIDTTDGL